MPQCFLPHEYIFTTHHVARRPQVILLYLITPRPPRLSHYSTCVLPSCSCPGATFSLNPSQCILLFLIFSPLSSMIVSIVCGLSSNHPRWSLNEVPRLAARALYDHHAVIVGVLRELLTTPGGHRRRRCTLSRTLPTLWCRAHWTRYRRGLRQNRTYHLELMKIRAKTMTTMTKKTMATNFHHSFALQYQPSCQ